MSSAKTSPQESVLLHWKKTNKKVELVLSDSSKYKKLDMDTAQTYQSKIKDWYSRNKPVLSSIKEDISQFLLPEDVSTPHLKVLIKTHKTDCPVRLTFSSVGSATRNLSSTLVSTFAFFTILLKCFMISFKCFWAVQPRPSNYLVL